MAEKRAEERLKKFLAKIKAKKVAAKKVTSKQASMKRSVLPSQCNVEPAKKKPVYMKPLIEQKVDMKALIAKARDALMKRQQLKKRQESHQDQERQKLRETARLKLQKMEESVEYEDNIGVTNDFHKLVGDNYRISDETSRDDFIWWNQKIKPSGFVQYSGCSFGMEGRQYSQLLQESQQRQKMREASPLKLQKMEESADYEDNISVMNDCLRMIGGSSFRFAENSRDDFIW